MQTNIYNLVHHRWFDRTIIMVIIINTLLLMLEASFKFSDSQLATLLMLDKLCIGIFVFEAILKIIALRKGYFKSGWNVFDFCVTVAAVMPFLYFMSVFRALRIFRLISKIPSLKVVVSALLISIPAMLSTTLLLFIIFVVFGIIGTDLFGNAFPQWFGNLGRSLYSLFQIMTLESWSMGIVRPIMEIYPLAWAFFIPFILLSAFILLNFLIGIIVDAIAHIKKEKEQEEHQDKIDIVLAKLDALQQEIEKLKQR